MVEISAKVYDSGAVGDGDLTETVDFPYAPSSPFYSVPGFRVTQDCYDWRDHLVAIKSGTAVATAAVGAKGAFAVDGLATWLAPNPTGEVGDTTTSRPITYEVLDNLGEVKTEDVFAGTASL